ncbi:unnamed protein product [Thelazia callipaeda]|uniref:CCHC-type domain-containing protein n=1 Tax=Thelazia callipaeda TaxID=103827 RepID=A0A0N5D1F4_THECL|nr:unnamed protein product [Thelazia callipaeda]
MLECSLVSLPFPPFSSLAADTITFVVAVARTEPGRLFVQLTNDAQKIVHVNERLQELAKIRHGFLCNPECGTIIGALYPVDGRFYRACVLSKVGIDSISVLYFDYGNTGSVDVNDAFLLQDSVLLSVPPMAIQLDIEGITDDARLNTNQITSLLMNQNLGAQILGVSSNEESFTANLLLKDCQNRSVDVKEVVLGERPVPVLPDLKYEPVMDEGNFRFSEHRCGRFRSYRDRQAPSWCNRSTNFHSEFNSGIKGCGCNRYGHDDHRGFEDVAQDIAMPYGRNRASVRGSRQLIGGYQRFIASDVIVGDESSQRYKKSIDEQICYKCGKSGHIWRACVEPYKNDSRKDMLLSTEGNDARIFSSISTGSKQCGLGVYGCSTSTDKGGFQHDGLFAHRGNLGLPSDERDEDCKLKERASTVYTLSEGEDSSSSSSSCKRKVKDEDEESERTGEINIFNRLISDDEDEFDTLSNLLQSLIPDSPVHETSDARIDEINDSVLIGSVEPFTTILKRIEPASLGNIEFGDMVDGVRSDLSEISDPLSFFVQLDRDKRVINQLILSNKWPCPSKLLSFETFSACLAVSQGYYHRAEIVGTEGDNQTKIMFVDTGSVKIVNASELYIIDNSLPKLFYTSRRMAFHCRLHNVMPIGFEHEFSSKARKVFSELTAYEKLSICFLQQSVKGVYEVSVYLSDKRSLSDLLVSRGFALPFKWGIGPHIPLYETLNVFRCDELDYVSRDFTVQLSTNHTLLDQVNSGYVNAKTTLNVPQIGDAVISYFERVPHRAEIIAIETNGDEILYRVNYVDYGNESVCTKDQLFALDRDLQPKEVLCIPRQGIRCYISGVWPPNNEKWDVETQKCISSILDVSFSFEAIIGCPNENGVFPIKITLPKSRLDVSYSTENEINCEKVDFGTWLIANGHGEMRNFCDIYPTKNLLCEGKHEQKMVITEINGQIIRARPCAFSDLYDTMNEALKSIEIIALESSATVGLINYNGTKKRAALIASSDCDGAVSKKCLLVDEGINVKELPAVLYGVGKLDDNNGFFVQTCHQLSVELKFRYFLQGDVIEKLLAEIMTSAPVKETGRYFNVVLQEM